MPKARQAQKIREIGAALEAAGHLTIQDKAHALGLSRSTTFALLKADHKNSGLTATLVNTILASPKLPETVRMRLLEYVDDKISGRFGHNPIQLRRFVSRLALVHQVAEGNRVAAAIRNRRQSGVYPTGSAYGAIGARSLRPAQRFSAAGTKFRRAI